MKQQKPTVVDLIKKKILDSTTEYFKEKINHSKKEILNYIEKEIERKIKKEIKKITKNVIFYLFIICGTIFLSFGLISSISYLLNLPSFMNTILYGLFLILIGIIVRIIY